MQAPSRADDVTEDAGRQMAAIMTFSQVKPGQKVIELVPAEGYWTKVFSGIVGPKGQCVYTIWPDGYQKYVGDSYTNWQKRITTPEYANVSLIRGAGSDLKVPEPVRTWCTPARTTTTTTTNSWARWIWQPSTRRCSMP